MTRLLCCCSLLAIVCLQPARAQITSVASRQALSSNTSIEWFAFGGAGAGLSTPVSKKFGNVKVTLASSSGELQVVQEGKDWSGDFTLGQFLLHQPNVSDNVLISFDPGVAALGTQIDPGGQTGYKGRFMARLCLYAKDNSFLGMVETTSTATQAEDGSARFIGARSSGLPIALASLQVIGVTPGFSVEGDLAANRLDVVVPSTSARVSPSRFVAAKPPACS